MFAFAENLNVDLLPMATLSTAQVLWIVLWIGMAVLSAALIAMMWTRWGQVKPLAKCIVLSVFAHVLLIGYAYSTKLFFDRPHAGGEEIVRLSLNRSGPDDRKEKSTQRPQPWEQAENETNVAPNPVVPVRRDTADQSQSQLKQIAQIPDFNSQTNFDSVHPDEPSRPVPPLPAVETFVGAKAAPVEAKIKTSNVARRVDTQTPLPRIEAPRPVTTPEIDTAARKPPLNADFPKDLLEATSPLQRLSNVNLKSDSADAIEQDRDNLRQSNNRVDNVARHNSTTQIEKSNGHQNRIDTAGPQQSDRVATAAANAPRRLGDGRKLPKVYNHRVDRDRLRLAKQYGGSAETEAAVDASLRWLAGCQHRDGRWDASQHGAGRATRALQKVQERPGAEADTGITGLVLLAFLARGHSHLEGQYRKNVQLALEYLLRSQKSDGSLAGNAKTYASMYCHGMASLALSEAYGITGDHRLKPYVERAVDYIVKAQHPTSGGWRYQPGDKGDMSQFGWQVMALKSAELAGIEIPARTKTGMSRFMNSVSSGRHGGLASYRTGEQISRAMTAEALTCRCFLDTDRNRATLQEAAEYITAELPAAGKANLYYWYYATLALFQMQGERWQNWNEALSRELLSRQNSRGNLAGSWDPDTEWGAYGGRVYSTAMATLSLEVYYRYLPLYGK